MNLPRLEREGVVLRPLELADAEAMYAAHGDPQTHYYWSDPAHESVEQTRQYIADTLAKDGAHAWAITESGGDALGRIALFIVREGVGEIGVIMTPQAAGRGLASKALSLVCEFGFGQLDLHRISADIDPDNVSSLSLFLRSGFAREGLLRGNWKTHIGIRDSVIMAKLRES